VTIQPIKVTLIKASIVVVLSALFAFVALAVPVHAEQEIDIRTNYKEISRFVEFDHIETGFALTGNHSHLACIKCHYSGQNEKLPHRCDACHDNQRATGMPLKHIPTREPCDICHTTQGFIEQIDMDHRNSNAPCVFCHDGYSQVGKGVSHIQSSNNCKICHNTQHWLPLGKVQHGEISISDCITCHNNVITRGKTLSKHLPSSDVCDACHDSHQAGWKVFTLDHNQVEGSCQSCHNGIVAKGVGNFHVPVILGCEGCHSTLSWQDTQFSHAQVAGLRCVRCHDSVTQEGKPLNHVESSDECDNCHDSASGWRNIRQFEHRDVSGPCQQCHKLPVGHFNSLDACDICHQTVSWNIVYVRHLSLQATACRACHNNGYAQGVPANHCPISEDCSTCHGVNNWKSRETRESCQPTGNENHHRRHSTNE